MFCRVNTTLRDQMKDSLVKALGGHVVNPFSFTFTLANEMKTMIDLQETLRDHGYRCQFVANVEGARGPMKDIVLSSWEEI